MIHQLTNSMGPSPSSEATSRLSVQEFLYSLWNPEICYIFQNSPPLVSILSQINAANTTQSISLRPILILSYYV
jgi:hypothetical protein